MIGAGLLAHIDIEKAQTVGSIWSFAGLNPDAVWIKGEKRPWNAQLKTLCWKIGESFVKLINHKDSFYSQIYKERKVYEWNRNLAGQMTAACEAKLSRFKIGKDTEAWLWYAGRVGPNAVRGYLERGESIVTSNCVNADESVLHPMLPPAHINERAKRYAVKLFLAHLHQRWYEERFGVSPPKPYILTQPGHTHHIEPPQVKL